MVSSIGWQFAIATLASVLVVACAGVGVSGWVESIGALIASGADKPDEPFCETTFVPVPPFKLSVPVPP